MPLPSLSSLLVTANSGLETCGLCGNSFEIGGSSESNSIELPCVDPECEACAQMWFVLNSPTCRACYADFKCNKSTGHRVQISFQDMLVAFYGVDADSDDDTISDPGISIRENDDTVFSHFRGEDLQEAVNLANSRAGTNFSFQEIEDDIEVPLAVLRPCIKTQLADALAQICFRMAEEGNEADAEDGSSHQPDEDSFSNGTSQLGGEIGHRCTVCQKVFRGPGHLRQHMVIHDVERRTCSVCGQILGSPSSRRVHERLHRETESQREKRLNKMRIAKNRLRAAQLGRKQ